MAQLKLSLFRVPKSVTWYLTCANALLKQARTIVVTHGIQKFRNRLSALISSPFRPTKVSVPRCIFRQNAPAVPATRLSLADESRGCIRVGCCCAMRQAGGRLWREIREVPLLRYVFAVSRCDELANARNQIEQAQ